MNSHDLMARSNNNVVTVEGGEDVTVEEEKRPPLSNRGSQISVTKTVQVSIHDHPEEDCDSLKTDLSTSTTRKSTEV